jgi:hypothetical protein
VLARTGAPSRRGEVHAVAPHLAARVDVFAMDATAFARATPSTSGCPPAPTPRASRASPRCSFRAGSRSAPSGSHPAPSI